MTRITPDGVGATFSVADLPVDDRIPRWEEHNADALIGLTCRTLGDGALEAVETNVDAGALRLARVHGTSHMVERNSAMVRARPSDAVALYLNLAGEAFFYDADGIVTTDRTRLLMVDADRPFTRGFTGGVAELVLTVPRDDLLMAAPGLRLDRPRTFDVGPTGDAFARALAGSMSRAVGESDGVLDERSLLDQVRALVGPRSGDATEAYHAAARTWIDAHLADPTLSAERVADAIGVSPRHLSRVFAAQGTSVPQFILGRRLDAARATLQGPAARTESVSEVARRWGFTSPAHFSTAFRRRFDQTAVEVRRQAMAARAG